MKGLNTLGTISEAFFSQRQQRSTAARSLMQLSSGRCEGGLRGRASRAVLPSLKSYYYIMQQPAPTANPAHATISWVGHGDAGMCHITSPTCRPRKPSPRNNLYCGEPLSPHCELHRSYGPRAISLNAPKSALVWCGWATPSVHPKFDASKVQTWHLGGP